MLLLKKKRLTCFREFANQRLNYGTEILLHAAPRAKSPLFYLRHFSLGLWFSFLVLCS